MPRTQPTPQALQRLNALLLDAIPDVRNWGRVIQEILKETGAAKGVLALRMNYTADFRLPAKVLESPLVVNFEPEFIESYVERYRALDPWTEIEKLHPPVNPFALSKYLPIEALKETAFWEWLEPQGISDTVVVRLGETEGHWAGLNIFFDVEDDRTRERVMALLAALQPSLRRVWEISEIHHKLSNQMGVRLKEISFMPLAAFFCRADGTANMVTEQLLELCAFNEDLLLSIEPKIRFRSHQVEFAGLLEQAAQLGQTASCDLALGDRAVLLSISRVTSSEDVLGRRTEQFLGVLVDPLFEGRRRFQERLARADLTERERELLDYLMESPKHTLVSFAARIGKTEHAADYHWRNIKKKLGILTLGELHAIS